MHSTLPESSILMTPPEVSPSAAIKPTLVLLGANMAHLEVLKYLAEHPLSDTRVLLITKERHTFFPDMLDGFLSQQCTLADAEIAIAPLVERAGAQWLQASVEGLDLEREQVLLSNGSEVAYQWLSLSNDSFIDRARVEASLPGARSNALFIQPLHSFAKLWPQVQILAKKRPQRIAVVGHGERAADVAIAIKRGMPHAAVTLIADRRTSKTPRNALVFWDEVKNHRITLLHDRVLQVDEDALQLGCGAALDCDVPIIAIDEILPDWVLQSGIAIGSDDMPVVDHHNRSISHGNLFVSSKACSTFAANLVRGIQGMPLKRPIKVALSYQAFVLMKPSSHINWRSDALRSPWLRWVKNRYDHALLARYQLP